MASVISHLRGPLLKSDVPVSFFLQMAFVRVVFLSGAYFTEAICRGAIGHSFLKLICIGHISFGYCGSAVRMSDSDF